MNTTRFHITGNAKDEAGGSYDKKDQRSKGLTSEREREVNEQEKEKTDKSPEKHNSFKDALQQWSNDNARDIEEDDSTPLRSGL